MKLKENISKLTGFQKITFLIILLSFVLLLSIVIPTLARFKNRNGAADISVWDGSVATSYKSGNGSEEDPYIISNGSELAYFSSELNEKNSYEGVYFELGNNIKLNDGIFSYDTIDGIEYILKGTIYYLDYFTNKYYENILKEDPEAGTINIFNSINNFKGIFNGNSYTIYGLYITDEDKAELALFNDLEGTVNDLYVENSLIYGGDITGGIASTSNNALIKNVLFSGNVINRSSAEAKNIDTDAAIDLINLETTETTNYIDLNSELSLIGKNIISTSLSGNYTLSGTTEANAHIQINDVSVSNGSFNIDLGTEILSTVSVSAYTDVQGATLSFSNLKYRVVYKETVASGIVGISGDTKLENVINKSFVYGYAVSSGLVGITNSSLEIKNSYNSGKIASQNFSGGLIGIVENSEENIIVDKSYNNGDLSGAVNGGLISVINSNSGTVSISDSFNLPSVYGISEIYSSEVNVSNTYLTDENLTVGFGDIEGEFSLTDEEELKTKLFMTENLHFSEFVDFEDLENNVENIWVYGNDALPILYIDDAVNPIAKIHSSIYQWDNYSTEINDISVNKKITFSIENNADLSIVREKYYYIGNSEDVLSKTELDQIEDWILYDNIVQITEAGEYIIYAKIVDINDNITYINTDKLSLDLTNTPVSIHMGDIKWSKSSENLDYVYFNSEKILTVEVKLNAEINEIKYYISDKVLNQLKLTKLEDTDWTAYDDKIEINNPGTYIVYIKAIDKNNEVSFSNTDFLVFNGYSVNNLFVGRNSSSYENTDLNINSQSVVTLKSSFSDDSQEFNNHSHNLISNILLPVGSKITLIDNITNRVYDYKITSASNNYGYDSSCSAGDLTCERVATYPFALFKETGAVNKNFVESSYYADGKVNEDFTINLDLSDTNILTNYNDVKLYLQLNAENGSIVRPTLSDTIKSFNIYSNISEDLNAQLYLESNYDGEITFNTESVTDIDISTGISYKEIDNIKIIDTSFESREIGLTIKMVNSNDEIISKEYLKTLAFKVNDKLYYPGNDGIVRINLENGLSDINTVLTVITNENKTDLEEGTYYLKISSYASYDGKHYNELSDTELSIPVVIVKSILGSDYKINVEINGGNLIFKKSADIEEIKTFVEILLDERLTSPTVTMSLYKKNDLTAYNQNYTILDINEYINEELVEYSENIYHVPNNSNFELNLISNKFENTGYKFVFSVYEGSKRVSTIEKYFIVR